MILGSPLRASSISSLIDERNMGQNYASHSLNCSDLVLPQDARHEKIDLKVVVIVIPKEGWARVAAPMTLTFQNLTLLTS